MNSVLLLLALSYVVGSINFSIVLCRVLGFADPRDIGSGNPGATNVSRYAGRWMAGLCLLLDGCKGYGVVVAAVWLGFGVEFGGLCGVVVIVGHCFSIFLKFQGGKGVATSLGVLFGVGWMFGGLAVGAWLIGFAVFRRSFMGALAAFVSLPVLLLLLGDAIDGYSTAIHLGCVGLAVFIGCTHRSNITSWLAR